MVLLIGCALLGALTIGTVLGAGATDPAPAPMSDGDAARPSAAALRSLDPSPAAPPTSAPQAPSPATALAPPAPPSPVPAAAAPSRAPRMAPASALARTTLDVRRPVAAFLGDSYTTGWAGAGTGRLGWPAIVSSEHGWRVVNRAVAGTGFVNPGWTGQPIRARLAAVLKAEPGIVFVAGGHNDNRFGPGATGKAADAVLQRLRYGLPDAVIVVIGPIWGNGTPPASIRAIRRELRQGAAAVGAVFVDPIRDGWFAGAARRFILADGIHASNGGHRRIAGLVLEALESLR